MRDSDQSGLRAEATIREIGCEVVDCIERGATRAVVLRPNRDAFAAWLMRGHRLEDWSGTNSVHFEPDPAA